MPVSTLTTHSHMKFESAKDAYSALNGQELERVPTQDAPAQQAERYLQHVYRESQPRDNSLWPGCSYFNYGVAVQIEIASVSLAMDLIAFRQLMANNSWQQINPNIDDGKFYCITDPALNEINQMISSLKQPQNGHAWLWDKAWQDYYQTQRELDSIEEQLNENENQFSQLTNEQSTLAARIEALTLIIGMQNYINRMTLLIALYNINKQIEEHEEAGVLLDQEATAIEALIAAYNDESERYNQRLAALDAEVQKYTQALNAWLNKRERMNELIEQLEQDRNNKELRDELEKLINELNEELDILNSWAASIEAEAASLDEIYNDLEEQKRIIEERAVTHNSNIEAWDAQSAALNQQKENIVNQINALPPINDGQLAELESIIREQQRLEQKEADLVARRNDLQEKQERLANLLEDHVEKADQHLRAIEEMVQTFKFRIIMGQMQRANPNAELHDLLDSMKRPIEEILEKLEKVNKIKPPKPFPDFRGEPSVKLKKITEFHFDQGIRLTSRHGGVQTKFREFSSQQMKMIYSHKEQQQILLRKSQQSRFLMAKESEIGISEQQGEKEQQTQVHHRHLFTYRQIPKPLLNKPTQYSFLINLKAYARYALLTKRVEQAEPATLAKQQFSQSGVDNNNAEVNEMLPGLMDSQKRYPTTFSNDRQKALECAVSQQQPIEQKPLSPKTQRMFKYLGDSYSSNKFKKELSQVSDVNRKNDTPEGDTALMVLLRGKKISSRREHKIAELLKGGALWQTKNNRGESADDLAKMHDEKVISRLRLTKK